MALRSAGIITDGALQGGCERLNNLRILFVSNNKLRDWSEVERLASLPKLEEVLFAGNPFYNDYKDKQAIPDYRIEASLAWPLRCFKMIAS